MAIAWNDNLKTGISIIDEQHQSLFETINKLGKFTESKDLFNEVLIDLQSYISVHFNTEEEYMKYTRYPEYEQHKACHEKFIEDYKNILKKKSTVNFQELGPELIVFLENWIENHYNDEDVKMASYINKVSLNN